MIPAIDIDQLTKTYKNLNAVDGISLRVEEGEYLALLGPNGAGKTTLLEMIEGITPPTSGRISVFGRSWSTHQDELRRSIGVCFQETNFMDKITVQETIQLFCSFYRLPNSRATEVIQKVNLEEKATTYVEQLSGGQRQRVAIAIAILNTPRLLMLDEPTTGLDAPARRDIWELVTELKSSGMTMILTTHYMEEAEVLCDRIVMLNRGKILKDGRLKELLPNDTSTLDDLFISMTGERLIGHA